MFIRRLIAPLAVLGLWLSSCGLLSGQAQGAGGASEPPAQAAGPLFGFTLFPYDTTLEAHEKTHEVADANSTLYVIQLTNGIPWAEALKDQAFPREVQNEWDDFAKRIPGGRAVYVALAPMAEDREALAPASKGSSVPATIKGARFDDRSVKTAYLNYARRAVDRFKPLYLNLGIESGELAFRKPDRWPQFADLFEHVRSALKKDHPELMIGISFGLQSLTQKAVADRVKPLVDSCDYLGLSFYPYMSPFHEKYGIAALPPPPDEWRRPLAWVRSYTSKPIAMCETGYTTDNVAISSPSINMKGTPDLQQQYLIDLAATARTDSYAFVVWFLPVDYDALAAKMPGGGGPALIWRHIGFHDKELRAKPAWETWKRIVAGESVPPAPSSPATTTPSPLLALGFAQAAELFSTLPPATTDLDSAGPSPGVRAMRWSYTYAKGKWPWCHRALPQGDLANAKGMSLAVKSDRAAPIVVLLKERDGEAYVATVDLTSEWRTVNLSWADFVLDPKTRKNGALNPEQAAEIVVSEPAGSLENASGNRSVWFAQWVMTR